MFIISLSEMVSLGTRDVFIRVVVGGTSDSPTCGPHSHVAATCHVTRHGPCRDRRGGTHFSHFVPQVTAQRYCFLHTFSRLSFDMNAEGRKEGKESFGLWAGQSLPCQQQRRTQTATVCSHGNRSTVNVGATLEFYHV